MDPAPASSTEGSPCPSGEALLAYLLAGDSGQHLHQPLTRHLGSCDACLLDLQRASRRLRLEAEIAAPVPASVRGAELPPVAAPQPSSWQRAWRRLVASLQLPVLAPAAAGLALVLAFGLPRTGDPIAPSERTRNVSLRQNARLTMAAPLHIEPTAQAAVLARLDRGVAVVLLDRRDAWVQIELADGTSGWMEQRAFE